MNTRMLPREEYPRLVGTELEALYPYLPENAVVVVVEEGEPGSKIIGCWSFYRLVHAEGIWIDPSHQGAAGVARALLASMHVVIQVEFQAAGFMTAAVNDQVAEMILKLGGTEVPGRHFAVNLQEADKLGQKAEEACLQQ